MPLTIFIASLIHWSLYVTDLSIHHLSLYPSVCRRKKHINSHHWGDTDKRQSSSEIVNILHFCLLFNINVKVRLSQLSWILASDDEFGCKMMVHFSMVSRTSCFCWLSIWQFFDPRYLIFFLYDSLFKPVDPLFTRWQDQPNKHFYCQKKL